MTETDILSLNQTRIIEQTIITYLPLGKLLEKRVKTIEEKIFRLNIIYMFSTWKCI